MYRETRIFDLSKEYANSASPDVMQTIYLRRGEVGSEIAGVINDHGEPFDVSDCRASFRAKCRDGSYVVEYDNVRVEGNTVVYTVQADLTSMRSDVMVAYFRFERDGANVTCGNIPIVIDQDADMPGDVAERYKSQIDRMIEEIEAEQAAMEEAEAARATAEAGRVAAEEGRVAEEAARDAAEEERAKAEDGRVVAEGARTLAEGERDAAEGKRDANESNRGKAENQRRSDEQNRKRAEEQRRADETVRKQNEVGRIELDSQRTVQQEKNNADQARNNELASGIPWEYLDDPSQYDPATGMPTIPDDEIDGRKLYSTPAPDESEDDARTEWQWRQLGDGSHRWEKIGSNTGKMPDPLSTDDVDGIVDAGGDLQSANIVNGTILSYYTAKLRNWLRSVGSIARLASSRSLSTRLDSNLPASFDGSTDAEIGVSGVLMPENGGTGQDLAASDPEELETARSAARATLGIEERTMFLLAHPVGDYWHTSSSTDPNEAYGGTWERVEGCFLYAREGAQEVGATGGSKTVALTTAQMPAHSHTVNSHTHSTPNHTHTWAAETIWTGNQTLNSSRTLMAAVKKSGEAGFQTVSGTGLYRDWTKTTTWMVSSGGGTSGAATPATNSIGSGAGHENMPPFVAINCWHRTG